MLHIKTSFPKVLLVVVVGIISLKLAEADFSLGCQSPGKLCDDFNGRTTQEGSDKFTTTKFAYCPDDPENVSLECTARHLKGCIRSTCMRKSQMKSHDQCRSVFGDDDDPKYNHTTNALQESCSSSEEMVVCCQPDSIESILLAGYGAEGNEFPHQALLLLHFKKAQGYNLKSCGATIYNEKWILTAAHCLGQEIENPNPNYKHPNHDKGDRLKYREPLKTNQVEVVVGSNLAAIAPISNRYRVKNIIIHEKYTARQEIQDKAIEEKTNPLVVQFDVALLELVKPITFNEQTTLALEMAPPNFKPEDYSEKVVLVGWGTTDNLDITQFLQKGDVKIRNNKDDCNSDSYDPSQHLCVGGIVNGEYGKTAGGGDSGGPAICRNSKGYGVHCGVTSYGGDDKMCAEMPSETTCTPSYYASVSYFRNWIIKNTGGGPQQTGATKFAKIPLYGIDAGNELSQVKISTGDGKSCGGTLVTRDTVVTAAHCVFDKDAKLKSSITMTFGGAPVTVKSVGLLSMSGEQKMTTVNDKFFQKFQRKKYQLLLEDPHFESDVAVIKLGSQVAGADPIPMSSSRLVESDAVVYESAWMRNTKTRGLRKFPAKIVGREICESRYKRLSQNKIEFKVGPTDVCMVEKYSGGSTCDREVGGGVFCDGPNGMMLCGIQTSRMCDFSVPKIVADISYFSSRIK